MIGACLFLVLQYCLVAYQSHILYYYDSAEKTHDFILFSNFARSKRKQKKTHFFIQFEEELYTYLITYFDELGKCTRFRRRYETRAACKKGRSLLMRPGPFPLGLACVLMLRPISPELVAVSGKVERS